MASSRPSRLVAFAALALAASGARVRRARPDDALDAHQLASAGPTLLGKAEPHPRGYEVVIGALFAEDPNAGEAASQELLAMQLALDRLNALPVEERAGITLRLAPAWPSATATIPDSAYKLLKGNATTPGAVALISALASDALSSVLALTEVFGVMAVSYIPCAPMIAGGTDAAAHARGIFQLQYSDHTRMRALADLVVSLRWKSVNICYQETVGFRELARELTKMLGGGCVGVDASISIPAVMEGRGALSRAARALGRTPSWVVVVLADDRSARRLMDEAAAQGLGSPPFIWLGVEPWSEPSWRSDACRRPLHAARPARRPHRLGSRSRRAGRHGAADATQPREGAAERECEHGESAPIGPPGTVSLATSQAFRSQPLFGRWVREAWDLDARVVANGWSCLRLLGANATGGGGAAPDSSCVLADTPFAYDAAWLLGRALVSSCNEVQDRLAPDECLLLLGGAARGVIQLMFERLWQGVTGMISFSPLGARRGAELTLASVVRAPGARAAWAMVNGTWTGSELASPLALLDATHLPPGEWRLPDGVAGWGELLRWAGTEPGRIPHSRAYALRIGRSLTLALRLAVGACAALTLGLAAAIPGMRAWREFAHSGPMAFSLMLCAATLCAEASLMVSTFPRVPIGVVRILDLVAVTFVITSLVCKAIALHWFVRTNSLTLRMLGKGQIGVTLGVVGVQLLCVALRACIILHPAFETPPCISLWRARLVLMTDVVLFVSWWVSAVVAFGLTLHLHLSSLGAALSRTFLPDAPLLFHASIAVLAHLVLLSLLRLQSRGLNRDVLVQYCPLCQFSMALSVNALVFGPKMLPLLRRLCGRADARDPLDYSAGALEKLVAAQEALLQRRQRLVRETEETLKNYRRLRQAKGTVLHEGYARLSEIRHREHARPSEYWLSLLANRQLLCYAPRRRARSGRLPGAGPALKHASRMARAASRSLLPVASSAQHQPIVTRAGGADSDSDLQPAPRTRADFAEAPRLVLDLQSLARVAVEATAPSLVLQLVDSSERKIARLEDDTGGSEWRAMFEELLEARQRGEALRQRLSVCVLSWNMGSTPPPPDRVSATDAGWLPSGAHDIYAIGLQECHLVRKAAAADGTDALRDYFAAQLGDEFRLVDKPIQLWERTAVLLFCHARWHAHITDVHASKEKAGFNGLAGNKGGVCLSLRVGETSFAFLAVHLAAHDAHAVLRHHHTRILLKALRPPVTVEAAGAERAFAKHHDVTSVCDYVFMFGDLNYRLDGLSREQVLALVSRNQLGTLYAHDQLHAAMRVGRVLSGFSELRPLFPPTYKLRRRRLSMGRPRAAAGAEQGGALDVSCTCSPGGGAPPSATSTPEHGRAVGSPLVSAKRPGSTPGERRAGAPPRRRREAFFDAHEFPTIVEGEVAASALGESDYDPHRTPAWCDRVLVYARPGARATQLGFWSAPRLLREHAASTLGLLPSDHAPVAASFEVEVRTLNASDASARMYAAWAVALSNVTVRVSASAAHRLAPASANIAVTGTCLRAGASHESEEARVEPGESVLEFRWVGGAGPAIRLLERHCCFERSFLSHHAVTLQVRALASPVVVLGNAVVSLRDAALSGKAAFAEPLRLFGVHHGEIRGEVHLFDMLREHTCGRQLDSSSTVCQVNAQRLSNASAASATSAIARTLGIKGQQPPSPASVSARSKSSAGAAGADAAAEMHDVQVETLDSVPMDADASAYLHDDDDDDDESEYHAMLAWREFSSVVSLSAGGMTEELGADSSVAPTSSVDGDSMNATGSSVARSMRPEARALATAVAAAAAPSRSTRAAEPGGASTNAREARPLPPAHPR